MKPPKDVNARKSFCGRKTLISIVSGALTLPARLKFCHAGPMLASH